MANDYQINPAQINQIAVKDVNRLVGVVAKALAANSPYINVLQGGTFASGMGDTVVAAVEMQAAPGDSFAVPTFIPQTQIAGTTGSAERTGKVDFSYQLMAKRGTGPKVSVKDGYGAFKTSYLTAEDALRKLITQYINADIQAQIVLKSGTKATCFAGNSLQENTVGGVETDINITWAGLDYPNAQLSFKALHSWARYLKEVLFGEMFPAGDKVQPHFRFIGGSDIIEAFRNEVSVQTSGLFLTAGQYKLGETMVTGYSFEYSSAYRGIAFGMTHRPLRFNTIGSNGIPVWINPVEIVSDSSNLTAYSLPNPAWLTAKYEVGVLLADGTFQRQVPEQYVGEGTFKYAPQLHGGELEWHYVKDNNDNVWGDYGFHKYQITRAYKPLRPQHIIPLIFLRAQSDLGLVAESSSGPSVIPGDARVSATGGAIPLVPINEPASGSGTSESAEADA
jgi:hypothetical protein